MRIPPQLCPGCDARVYFYKRAGGRAIAIDADSKRITIVTDAGELARGFQKHDCTKTSGAPEPPVESPRPPARKSKRPAGRLDRVISEKAISPTPERATSAREPVSAAPEDFST